MSFVYSMCNVILISKGVPPFKQEQYILRSLLNPVKKGTRNEVVMWISARDVYKCVVFLHSFVSQLRSCYENHFEGRP